MCHVGRVLLGLRSFKNFVFADCEIRDTMDPMANPLSTTLAVGHHDDACNECLRHQ